MGRASWRRAAKASLSERRAGSGALSSLDGQQFGALAPMLVADRQGRHGLAAPWAMGKTGKEYRATVDRKPVIGLFGVGLEEAYRWKDSGPQANLDGSGYERLLISPGFRFNVSNVRVNANVALPVYQHVNGNQLISPALFKLSVSYSF